MKSIDKRSLFHLSNLDSNDYGDPLIIKLLIATLDGIEHIYDKSKILSTLSAIFSFNAITQNQKDMILGFLNSVFNGGNVRKIIYQISQIHNLSSSSLFVQHGELSDSQLQFFLINNIEKYSKVINCDQIIKQYNDICLVKTDSKIEIYVYKKHEMIKMILAPDYIDGDFIDGDICEITNILVLINSNFVKILNLDLNNIEIYEVISLNKSNNKVSIGEKGGLVIETDWSSKQKFDMIASRIVDLVGPFVFHKKGNKLQIMLSQKMLTSLEAKKLSLFITNQLDIVICEDDFFGAAGLAKNGNVGVIEYSNNHEQLGFDHNIYEIEQKCNI